MTSRRWMWGLLLGFLAAGSGVGCCHGPCLGCGGVHDLRCGSTFGGDDWSGAGSSGTWESETYSAGDGLPSDPVEHASFEHGSEVFVAEDQAHGCSTCGGAMHGCQFGGGDCGDCGGCSDCGGWCFPLLRKFWFAWRNMHCVDGCAEEVYWGDYHNDPPLCREPCDECGNWTGRGPLRAPYTAAEWPGGSAVVHGAAEELSWPGPAPVLAPRPPQDEPAVEPPTRFTQRGPRSRAR